MNIHVIWVVTKQQAGARPWGPGNWGGSGCRSPSYLYGQQLFGRQTKRSDSLPGGAEIQAVLSENQLPIHLQARVDIYTGRNYVVRTYFRPFN